MNDTVLINKEYERLKGLFFNADETKLSLVDELIGKAAFLKVELNKLEKQINKFGAIQYSTKGNARISIAYKTYLQTVSVYQNVLKSIDKIMGKATNDGDDEFDDFIKNGGK